LALAAIMVSAFISTVAGSIANTALPTIANVFHVTAGTSVWVVNGVQIATTATLLLFAALSDSRGARGVFLNGTVVFTLACVACAVAPSFAFLVAARVVAGVGLAAMMVSTNPLTRAMFPPHQLGQSVAITAIFIAVGTASGPTIGGLVLAVAPWQWTFGCIVPFGVLSWYLAWRYLPDQPGNGGHHDWLSSGLAAVGAGGSVITLEAIARRWNVVETALAAVTSAVALTVFVRRQLVIVEPLLAIELFREPVFTVSVIASSLTYTAQGLAYVVLPFFFQSVLGRTPLESGLLLSAWPLTALIVATQMGRISDRYRASVLCTVGIAVMCLGLALFALLPAAPSAFAIVACAAVAGAGYATFQTPNVRAILVNTPPEKTGRAAGLTGLSRLMGQTTGVALVAIVFELSAGGTGVLIAPSRGAVEIALLVGCGFLVAAGILSGWRMRLRQGMAVR
jgi:DHA2 family multidrug resistance protein-like MFS transporter